MKTKIRSFATAAMTSLLLCLSTFAQQESPLTNDDVVAMLKAGLSADVVAAKIKTSPTKFDTSPAALQRLKEASVSDVVLLAMLGGSTSPVPARGVDGLPEYGTVDELIGKTKVFVVADSTNSRKMIANTIERGKRFEVVNSPDEAEFTLIYTVESSTESLGRRPSHYMRSQMKAVITSVSGRKRIVWSDDEDYEQTNGMSFSRPNEMNLIMNLHKALKKLEQPKKTKTE